MTYYHVKETFDGRPVYLCFATEAARAVYIEDNHLRDAMVSSKEEFQQARAIEVCSESTIGLPEYIFAHAPDGGRHFAINSSGGVLVFDSKESRDKLVRLMTIIRGKNFRACSEEEAFQRAVKYEGKLLAGNPKNGTWVKIS